MKKVKIFVMMLAITMLCMAVSATSVLADESTITWTYADNVLTISGNGAMPDYEVNKWNESTAPWDSVLDNCTKIIIEDGVTSIGRYAFYECSNTEEIIIANSVETISDYAFDKCNEVKKITLGTGLKNVGSAFTHAVHLEEVHIPDINTWCRISFEGPLFDPWLYKQETNLYVDGVKVTEVVIPNDVTIISNYAFHGVNGLQSVTLHDGVISIGHGAFAGTGITEIQIPNKVTSIGSRAFFSTRIDQLTIPNSVVSIGKEAFACTDIQTLMIPNNVKIIGSGAFRGCASLLDVSLPEGLISIPADMFASCTNLKDITIPITVTSIGYNTFHHCDSLTNIIIPDSVTTIDYGAFSYCPALTNIVLPSNLESIPRDLFCGSTALESINIPSSVTSIGSSAFENCATLSNITLPSSVTTIGEYAFSGCTNLSELTLSDSLTTIGQYAFKDLKALTNIEIPARLETLGDYAFGGCSNLSEIVFVGTAPSIGANAFNSVTATCYYTPDASWTNQILISDFGGDLLWTYEGEEITKVCGDNVRWELTDAGVLVLSGTGAMYDYSVENSVFAPWYEYRQLINTIEIGDGITYVGDAAFYNCINVKSIVMQDSVTEIGDMAFYMCTATSVQLSSNLETIGAKAFYCLKVKDLVLPDSITSIGIAAFSNTALNSVVLPENLEQIPDNVFEYCYNLRYVDFPSKLISIGNYAFNNCYEMYSIVLPEGLKSIGNYAFAGCGAKVLQSGYFAAYNFKTVTLPSTIKSIGASAFAYCQALTSINLPEGLTVLERNVFSQCISLSSINIPANIERISSDTFLNCKSLKVITFNWNAPSISNEAFSSSVSATCYYPGNNAAWTTDILQNYGAAKLVWIAQEMEEPDIGTGGGSGDNSGDSEGDDSGDSGGTDSGKTDEDDNTVPGDGTGDNGSNEGSDGGNGGNTGSENEGGNESGGSNTCTHTETAIVTAPTCTTGGYTTHTCTKCGSYYISDHTNPVGHNYINGVCTACGEAQPGPIITQQPVNGEAKMGERYMVEVKAEGEGLKYQWYFRNAGTETWHKSSVRDNTYDDVMTKARSNREVYCVITDANGNCVTTETAKLICIPAVKLEIVTQPTDGESILGDQFCVTVEARGDGLKYQWYFRNAGSDVWHKSGVRDNTYDDIMTRARSGREIYCVITDAYGNSVTTDVATLVRNPVKLEVISQPADSSAFFDERFCSTVVAKGDGLKYQWYFRNAGSDVWHKSGVRDNTYDDVMTKARNGREIYCVITDEYGNSVTTDVVKLMAVPRVELQLLGQSYESAVMGERYCVTVEAVGDGLKYQWYFRNAGSDTWYKSSVKDNTYDDVMTKARANREVYCVITDACGNQVTTEIVTLTVGK